MFAFVYILPSIGKIYIQTNTQILSLDKCIHQVNLNYAQEVEHHHFPKKFLPASLQSIPALTSPNPPEATSCSDIFSIIH